MSMTLPNYNIPWISIVLYIAEYFDIYGMFWFYFLFLNRACRVSRWWTDSFSSRHCWSGELEDPLSPFTSASSISTHQVTCFVVTDFSGTFLAWIIFFGNFFGVPDFSELFGGNWFWGKHIFQELKGQNRFFRELYSQNRFFSGTFFLTDFLELLSENRFCGISQGKNIFSWTFW